MDQSSNMDYKLPNGLESLIMWLMSKNVIQSWRLSCEKQTILSIKFTQIDSMATSTPQAEALNCSPMHDCSYRSKPRSAVIRDQMRQQAWLYGKQDNIEDNMPTSTAQPPSLYTDSEGVVTGANGFTMDYENAINSNQQSTHDTGYNSFRSVSFGNIMCSDTNHAEDALLNNTSLDNDTKLQDMSNTHQHQQHVVLPPPICSVSSQTMETCKSIDTQTVIVPVPHKCVLTQQPTMKKRGSQTDKISSREKDMQSDPIIYLNAGSQIEHSSTASVATMIELTIGVHKSISTDPPIDRHMQTHVVKTLTKKVGVGKQNKSSQVGRQKCKQTPKYPLATQTNYCIGAYINDELQINLTDIPFIDEDVT